MHIKSKLLWLSATATLSWATTAATAQEFPTRPIHVVVPFSVGSGPDAVMRKVGEDVGQTLGQQVIIENKPGANGWLSANEVKRAKPDGYTLLVLDNAHVALQPHLYKDMPFSPSKDFEPVAPLYSTYFYVVVATDSPWQSVSDLIAAAKKQDGKLTYGSWGLGSIGHVGSSTFSTDTNTTMTHVPFKELPQLYTSVANGDVDWAFGSAATTRPLRDANKVKLLAYAAPSRSSDHKNVPTVSEDGGPAGFELMAWVATYAPKDTPKEVIRKLNEGISKALANPDVQKSFATFGFEPWAGSPEELAEAGSAGTKFFADVVKRTAISID